MSGHIYCRDLRGSTQQRWYAVIDTGRPGEPRKQVTRSFSTRRAAKAWAAQMAADRRAVTTSPSVSEWLHGWIDGRVSLRASTLASYRSHIDRYLIPLLGDQPLAELRSEHIQRAHHQLVADGMTPATLARVHATLSTALNTAHRRGLLTSNPLLGVELPRHDPPVHAVWTMEQAQAFLIAVRGDQLEALWRTALTTGMRRGELLGLRWADVALDRGMVQVANSRTVVGREVVEGPPKTRAGRRILHLDPQTTRVLRHVNQTSAGVGPVFVSGAGAPLHPAWVSRRFTELCTQAGVPVIRFHDLRHTSATLGLASGESLKAVSQRLGHADIAITANRYLQVPDDTARKSAAELAGKLDRRFQQRGRAPEATEPLEVAPGATPAISGVLSADPEPATDHREDVA